MPYTMNQLHAHLNGNLPAEPKDMPLIQNYTAKWQIDGVTCSATIDNGDFTELRVKVVASVMKSIAAHDTNMVALSEAVDQLGLHQYKTDYYGLPSLTARWFDNNFTPSSTEDVHYLLIEIYNNTGRVEIMRLMMPVSYPWGESDYVAGEIIATNLYVATPSDFARDCRIELQRFEQGLMFQPPATIRQCPYEVCDRGGSDEALVDCGVHIPARFSCPSADYDHDLDFYRDTQHWILNELPPDDAFDIMEKSQ